METSIEDEHQFKGWLVALRTRQGLSQQEVADELGVERKTIYNAESPKQGNVSGLTLWRMLRLYGALADPPAGTESLSDRLARVEDQVLRSGTAATTTLAGLEEQIRLLRQQLELPGERANQGRSS